MLTTTMTAAAFALQAAPDSHASHAGPSAAQTASIGTEALFTEDSAVFETGGIECTNKEYLAHHQGPELAAFRSFAFSDYTVAVRIEGDVAETYDYRIETKTGEIATRKGVATSMLARTADGWKILIMHNSARNPKGA